MRIGGWTFDFLFNTRDYDVDGVLACLWDAYAPDYIIDQAEGLMASCDYNCGFTYSNDTRRRAVVMIGPAESGEEFIDTLVHEIHHVAVAVAESLGADLDSEKPAYLSGDVAREMADIMCHYGCGRCGCCGG